MASQQSRGRLVLFGMVLFFAAPIVIVLLMHALHLRPAGASHGVLVREAKPLTWSGQPNSLWQEKWNMLYVADQCAQDCMDRLTEMRQIHASLEKDIPRVQRVFITAQAPTAELQQRYPDMQLISDAGIYQQAWQQIGQITQSQQVSIYLVDPYGNLAIRFPPDLPAKDIRKDLLRLLKYSWAG